MGMFTWKTSDTKRTLGNTMIPGIKGCCYTATLIHPTNKEMNLTGTYDGYGRLDGVPIMAWVMCSSIEEWQNDYEDSFMSKFWDNYKENSKKIVLVEHYTGQNFEDLDYSRNCETQGFMFDE